MYLNGVVFVLLIDIGIECNGLVKVVNWLFYFVVVVWYYNKFEFVL